MGLLLSLNFNRRHSPFYRYQSKTLQTCRRRAQRRGQGHRLLGPGPRSRASGCGSMPPDGKSMSCRAAGRTDLSALLSAAMAKCRPTRRGSRPRSSSIASSGARIRRRYPERPPAGGPLLVHGPVKAICQRRCLIAERRAFIRADGYAQDDSMSPRFGFKPGAPLACVFSCGGAPSENLIRQSS